MLADYLQNVGEGLLGQLHARDNLCLNFVLLEIQSNLPTPAGTYWQHVLGMVTNVYVVDLSNYNV